MRIMKIIPMFFLLLNCGGSEEPYQSDFLTTTNCRDCIKDVQEDIRYINCVPVAFDKSNLDLVGTWWYAFPDFIDGVLPILDLRKDGVLRRIYQPGPYEGNQIRSSKWSFSDGIFSETNEHGTGQRLVSKIGTHYILWENTLPYQDTPWIKVECEGFGFGEKTLPAKPSCDCDADEMCQNAPFGAGEVCVPTYVQIP